MKHVVAAVFMLAVTGMLAPRAEAGTPRATPVQAKDGEGDASGEDQQKNKRLTDGQIRKILIEESIAAYSGNCPCPYSTMRNGRSCGRRSAYSREGGEAPLCYAKDVTGEMVAEWRAANGQE